MSTFDEIKINVRSTRRISDEVVDEFLIYYAAAKNKVDTEFERKIKPYRHIITKMPDGWKNYLKAQYIAHEIFRQNGLIRKYLNHSDVSLRSREELEYLKLQKDHPWRYSFSEILDNPHPDLYTMRDHFTGEEYQLYSGSVSEIRLLNPDIRTWFMLIGFDGMCMESYGPVMYFQSFDRDDLTFFARELDSGLENGSDIAGHIENNSILYSMLWSGAKLPVVAHKKHIIKYHAARYLDDDFQSEPFKTLFKIEYAQDVYRFGLKDSDSFPHYATAYFDEKDETLHLIAMTAAGFEKLVEAVNACGYDLPVEAHESVSPSMLQTASDILKKEVTINPFEHLFAPEEQHDEGMENINRFLELLTETLNSHKKPDIKKMADKAGIDYETAADLTDHMLKRLEGL